MLRICDLVLSTNLGTPSLSWNNLPDGDPWTRQDHAASKKPSKGDLTVQIQIQIQKGLVSALSEKPNSC